MSMTTTRRSAVLSPRKLLHEHPIGARRRLYLGVVVLAVFISAYEGQLAPVLPLLLADLQMSLQTYGLITAVSLLVGAAAGYLGGELVDRLGRVRILVPFAFLSAGACVFLAASESVAHFTAARILLAFVEGVAVAGTAPLIRDFTPRMGRAQAFAFWTWGPVGANFFAAGIAALTLDFFNQSWRSQIYLMAAAACVGAMVVALVLRDLSPELRRTVRTSEHAVRETTDIGGNRLALLLRNRSVWAHIIANSLLFILLATMNAFAQLMLVEQFSMGVQAASGITMGFWLCNLAGSLYFSRLSDRAQRRKPFMVAGSGAATLFLGMFVFSMRYGSDTPIMLLAVLLAGTGVALGAVFGPWMASFSEHIEEIHPDAQGLAFGVNHLVTRLFILAAVFLAPRVVAVAGWETWMTVAAAAAAGFLLVISQIQGTRRPRHPKDPVTDANALRTPAH
jgi:OPA family glycerol-3-phosphate transporter-like MFS transporter